MKHPGWVLVDSILQIGLTLEQIIWKIQVRILRSF